MSGGGRATGSARTAPDVGREVDLQPARARHAPQISTLYRQAYAGPVPADPATCYPFPQLMDPGWVAEALSRDTLRWFVAVAGGQVVGTIGATPNVGAPGDQVSEYFGLVVDKAWRGRGIARSLYERLYRSLLDTSSFMIAETRTAHPGGWRTVCAFDFVPLGFEPFAHHTPAGAESMIVLGHVSAAAGRTRVPGAGCSPAVHALAETVLGLNGLPSPPRVETSAPVHVTAAAGVERDDTAGRELLAARAADTRHASGVVALRRLEGIDPAGRRYTDACFVDRTAAGAVARVLWDHVDRRARVLSMHTPAAGGEVAMMAQIARSLEALPQGGPGALVVEVRADRPDLHAGLEALGFFPTVYYPGLLDTGAGRVDAVQLTRLVDVNIEEVSVNSGTALCPGGSEVARRVAALARAAVRNRR